eukprot:TRINITY_DN6218_c0_g2_i1.p1 TRINITY_DN6218_c0_g2~~TRINITY_DN6218_c0_g2_i1.p1  ORF type:complete len:140 (+),score=25.59 TRINITY_DN6218_c0_g2_i1:142-561(+)
MNFLNFVCFYLSFSRILKIDCDCIYLVVYYNDMPIGAISCKKEVNEDDGQIYLYIMTIGILEPYRKLGLGTKLLGEILEAATNDEEIVGVRLHVWVTNVQAKAFYERHGFVVEKLEEGYYTSVDPPNAYHLVKMTPNSE